MLILGAVGLGFAIVLGLVGFISEMIKPHPDAQVLLAYLGFITTPLLVIGNVVYSRDQGDDDR